jgi:hypothetical protein
MTDSKDMKICHKTDYKKDTSNLPSADANGLLVKILPGLARCTPLLQEMNLVYNHLHADTKAHLVEQSTTPFHRTWHRLPTDHPIFKRSCSFCNAGVPGGVILGDSSWGNSGARCDGGKPCRSVGRGDGGQHRH